MLATAAPASVEVRMLVANDSGYRGAYSPVNLHQPPTPLIFFYWHDNNRTRGGLLVHSADWRLINVVFSSVGRK